MLETTLVTNDEELSSVAEKISQIKKLGAFIKQEKEKFTKPAKEIIATANGRFDPFIKECQNGEIVLKQRAAAYMEDKEEKRKLEEARIAARVEKGTMKPETAIKKMEAMPEEQKTVRTESGAGLGLRKRKVAVIKNPELVPDEYWIIDEVRVRKEALEKDKNGESIPGVIIEETTSVASV
jgi:hypothetical protein